MKDSAREEELRQQIFRLRDAYDKKKWMRVQKTFLGLSGVIYLITFYWGTKSDNIDIDIGLFLSWLVGVPMLAGFIMFIAIGILFYCITESFEEEKTIARLVGRLEGIEEAKRSKKD